MIATDAERIAAKANELCPCWSLTGEYSRQAGQSWTPCICKGGTVDHFHDCPANEREVVLAALLEAYAEGERASAASRKRLVEALRGIEWMAGSNTASVLPGIQRRAEDALAAEAQEGEPKP